MSMGFAIGGVERRWGCGGSGVGMGGGGGGGGRKMYESLDRLDVGVFGLFSFLSA